MAKLISQTFSNAWSSWAGQNVYYQSHILNYIKFLDTFYDWNHGLRLLMFWIRIFEQTFVYVGPKLLNALPVHLRTEQNTEIFKRHVKTMLFRDSEEFIRNAFRYDWLTLLTALLSRDVVTTVTTSRRCAILRSYYYYYYY